MNRTSISLTLITIITILLSAGKSFAQIEVNSTGQVIIGSNVSGTVTELEIGTTLKYGVQTSVAGTSGDSYGFKSYVSNTASKTYGAYTWAQSATTNYGGYFVGYNGSTAYGLHAQGYGSSQYYSYGVSGNANGASVSNYGVYGSASGGNTAYGVYGAAGGATTNWGGYFAGNVHTTGVYSTSDERIKTDIVDLATEGTLQKLMRLKPRSYRFKSSAELIASGIPPLEIEAGTRYGVLAQDLLNVFPELVKATTFYTGKPDEEGTQTFEGYSVNYVDMIPILIATVQIQQQEIEELKTAVADLQSR